MWREQKLTLPSESTYMSKRTKALISCPTCSFAFLNSSHSMGELRPFFYYFFVLSINLTYADSISQQFSCQCKTVRAVQSFSVRMLLCQWPWQTKTAEQITLLKKNRKPHSAEVTATNCNIMAMMGIRQKQQTCNSRTKDSFQPASVKVLFITFQTAFFSYWLFWLLCLMKRWSSVEPFFSLVFITAPLASMRLGRWWRGGCSTAYLSVELPEVSGCCVSVESVTQAFPLPIFCFLGHSLEYFCLFLHLCLNSQIWVRLASFFLPQLHHGMLVSLSCLGFLLPPGWSDDDFLFRICCVSWFASLHLSHPTYVWLAILEQILGFQSWFISWFLYTEDYREVITPVLCQGFCTFPWCQLWGHQCQVDCTASVPLSSCRVPG